MHIRAALTSFEVWQKYVFSVPNSTGKLQGNTEDLSQIIRFNFPEYIDIVRKELLGEFEEAIEFGDLLPPGIDVDDIPGIPNVGGFVPSGIWKSITDTILGDFTVDLLQLYIKRNEESVRRVHSYISDLGRSHYGKTYLAGISKKLCAKSSQLDDLDPILDDGEFERDPSGVTVTNPCTGEEIDLASAITTRKLYSHIPTNDGAWIENCGTVLGLGSPGGLLDNLNGTSVYLDFFRKDDGRVGPFARIDSKTFANLFDVEAIIDDTLEYIDSTALPWLLGQTGSILNFPNFSPVAGPGGKVASSWVQTMYKNIVSLMDEATWDLIVGAVDIVKNRFYTGFCGELDYSQLDKNNYVVIRDFAICAPPDPDSPFLAIDLPSSAFIKFRVEETIILRKKTVNRAFRPKGNIVSADECCGKFHNDSRSQLVDCYMSTVQEVIQANKDCIPENNWVWQPPVFNEQDTVKYYIPIVFDAPLFKRDCDSLRFEETGLASTIEGAMQTSTAANGEKQSKSAGIKPSKNNKLKRAEDTVVAGPVLGNNIEGKVEASVSMCGELDSRVIDIVAASMDASAVKNGHEFHPPAHIPDSVAIPLKSNMETYGPWKSKNWDNNAGGVNYIKDNDLCPWVLGSADQMNVISQSLVSEQQVALSEAETGSVNYPYWPEIPLGFLDTENGPNLTRVNVNMGSNGVNTTYSFSTYSPKFGRQATLEKENLKRAIKTANSLKKEARERERKLDVIRRKTDTANFPALGGRVPSITDTGTLDSRILFGQVYPMQKITRITTKEITEAADPCCGHYSPDYPSASNPCYMSSGADEANANCDPSTETKEVTGAFTTAKGERTIVGGTSLEKSILELRYDFENKAFMSWDGLLGPVSVSGGLHVPGGPPSGNFPMYASYRHTGNESGSMTTFNSPNPPMEYTTLPPDDSSVNNEINNIEISRDYTNPLTNPFPDKGHHHLEAGAGHSIDVVANGKAIGPHVNGVPVPNVNPITAVGYHLIKNFQTQKDWAKRYDSDYRFLGLRGPLVLHQWGYDTQGKPIPNAIDDIDLIQKSGIFRTTVKPEEKPFAAASGPGSGLQDYFLQDWLQQPTSWPVAPVDLRYDRKRGMWVSPPDYKIVVVEPKQAISAFSSGEGKLINNRGDQSYNPPVYDAHGNVVESSDDEKNNTKIVIEDRIGAGAEANQKSYAYFDSFSSTYLLLGAGGGTGLRIGKFVNQWPSLPNVKDPKNAVKEVQVYTKAPSCDGYTSDPTEDCPWALIPEMKVDENGVSQPVVEQVLNLMANVAAAEYQTKWCVFGNIGGSNILISAEC